jgi:hypothetical protein
MAVPKAFVFLTKAQYDVLSREQKIAYLDRAIEAWQLLKDEEIERSARPPPGSLEVTRLLLARSKMMTVNMMPSVSGKPSAFPRTTR